MDWSNLKGLARDWLLATAVVVVLWFVWIQFMAPGPVSEGPAPDFTLSDLTGNEVRLSEHSDVVVLNFWFTSCPPCRHEIPELSAFHEANPDVPIYGVSVDRMAPERLAAMSKRLGITYPVLHDATSQVAQKYSVSLFPTTIVIHDGGIAHVRMGEVTRSSLEAMVASVH
ncbi:MAG: TlpA disulfide reductase family protein [Myxococcota bacterium]